MNIFKKIKGFFVKPPHICKFETFVQKHFWRYKEDGTTSGMHEEINDTISNFSNIYKDKSDPKRANKLAQLKEWKSQGYTHYHVSWYVHMCSCGDYFKEEFMECPHTYIETAAGRKTITDVVKMVT